MIRTINTHELNTSDTTLLVDREETRTLRSADNDLRQRVLLFLLQSSVPGLRRVNVSVSGDMVTLSGPVRTFYEKQLAVRLSRRVAGVIQVVDLVEVTGYIPRGDSGPRRSTGRSA